MSGVVSSVSLAAGVRPARHRLGVRGGGWWAVLDERGTLSLPDDTVCRWLVAAEDRWHDPAAERSVRQERRAGVPVVETRVRVPGGDVVQRAYGVPDDGGAIAIQFRNDSGRSVAVAVTHPAARATRPGVAPQGVELPAGSTSVPLAHGTSTTVVVPVGGVAPDPGALPEPERVQAAWLAAVESGGRIESPDRALTPTIHRLRADALIAGWRVDDDDPVVRLLTWHELVKCGERASDTDRDDVSLAAAADAERLARASRRSLGWRERRALVAARCVLAALDEPDAADDVAHALARLPEAAAAPNAAPDDVAAVAWAEEAMVDLRGDAAVLLPRGLPRAWWGVNVECHDLTVSPAARLSFAVRWHGERPALLWEASAPGVRLLGGGLDAAWSTHDQRGEALLAAPQ